MNIAQTLHVRSIEATAEIKAGGPGSGRKPGQGSSPMDDPEIAQHTAKMHQWLVDRGVKGGLNEISPKARRVGNHPEFKQMEDARTAAVQKWYQKNG